MSDKRFKVKSGLTLPISSANILTTDSDGNISSSSVLSISAGGTGQTTVGNAINALLPVQGPSTVNYTIQSDGYNISWAKVYNQVIQNDSISVTPRRNLNFVGASFADSSGSDTTTVTFPINSYLRESFTPTSGQTTFTLSNPTIVGAEQVFLNGILLVQGSDYSMTDESTLELSTGANLGDSLEVSIITNLTSAGVLSNYKQEINITISSDTTLVDGYRYFVDTTSTRTLTLPASPSLGDEVVIFDASGSAGTNNITIARNGKLINGNAGNFIIDISGSSYKLTYTGSTYGWSVK